MNDLTTTVIDVRHEPDLYLRKIDMTHYETPDLKWRVEVDIDNTCFRMWRMDAYALMLELERILTGSTSEEDDQQ